MLSIIAAEGPHKCEIYKRKFAILSDDSEFKTNVFRTANEEGCLTKRYISCPWVWASKQINND